MTCVQIRSIYIDGFENVKKKIKMVPHCHGSQPKSPKREKNVFTPAKIFQVRENGAKQNF